MKDIVLRHQSGEHSGICPDYSVHPLIRGEVQRFDRYIGNNVLAEATSRQITQFAGDTGLRSTKTTAQRYHWYDACLLEAIRNRESVKNKESIENGE